MTLIFGIRERVNRVKKKEELNNIFAQSSATQTNEDDKGEEVVEDQSESETLEI